MTRLILGIDPGTTESGICLIEAKDFAKPNILNSDKLENQSLKLEIESLIRHTEVNLQVVIEGMANQSRAFGQSSIETCYLIGRLMEFCKGRDIPVTLYRRHEYGRFFVNSGVLNDATLRAALETIWGPSAKKNDPLYVLRGASDKRSAYALAKYHEHMIGSRVIKKDFLTF